MKTLITGALVVVYLLLPIDAGAQAPRADAYPRVSKPAVDRLVVVDTRPSPRRFKVEALGFRALDESGYDFIGADEVIVIIRVPAHNVLTASVSLPPQAAMNRASPVGRRWQRPAGRDGAGGP